MGGATPAQGLGEGGAYFGRMWGEGIGLFQGGNGLVDFAVFEEGGAESEQQGRQPGIPTQGGPVFSNGFGILLLDGMSSRA
jgi:hypothetical protein